MIFYDFIFYDYDEDIDDNHDAPSFSSDLFLDNKQTPLIFSSEYIFNARLVIVSHLSFTICSSK